MAINLDYGTSLAFVLVASFMWNTWSIALKYLGKDYPLDAFLLDIYLVSVVLMWGVGFALEGPALTAQMAQAWQKTPHLIPLILVIGILFSIGICIGQNLVYSVGLILTVAVRSSIVILLGTLVSIQVGGLPEGASAGLILVAAVLLLIAVIAGMQASQERERNHAQLAVTLGRVDWKVLGQAVASALLILVYSYGLSAGVRSTSQPQGMDAVAYMALLSVGSAIGALLWCGGRLTVRGQWTAWRRAPARYHGLAAACAVAHFGGNLIHALGVPTLSTAIAWPLGTAGNLWMYLWGVVYGEFKGASRRAWQWLGVTLLLFIVGSVLLAMGQYGS